MFVKSLALLLLFLYLMTGTDGLLCPLRDDLSYFCKTGEVCCGKHSPRCCSTLKNETRTNVLSWSNIKPLPIPYEKEVKSYGQKGIDSSNIKPLPIPYEKEVKPYGLKGIDWSNIKPLPIPYEKEGLKGIDWSNIKPLPIPYEKEGLKGIDWSNIKPLPIPYEKEGLKGIDWNSKYSEIPQAPSTNEDFKLRRKSIKFILGTFISMIAAVCKLCGCASSSDDSEENEPQEPRMANNLEPIPLPYHPLNGENV